jgi:hypothetical protein
MPPLASAAFFAAIYVPRMMPAFTREESAQECIATIVDQAAYVQRPLTQTAMLLFKKNSGKYCLSSLVSVILEMRNGNDSVIKKTAIKIGSFLRASFAWFVVLFVLPVVLPASFFNVFLPVWSGIKRCIFVF